jgi:hypothetical protein
LRPARVPLKRSEAGVGGSRSSAPLLVRSLARSRIANLEGKCFVTPSWSASG